MTSDRYLDMLEESLLLIHQRIPHLSPSEFEWLQNEMYSENTTSKRILAASDSIEFSKSIVSNTIHVQLGLIKNFKNEINNKNKKKHLYLIAEQFLNDGNLFSKHFKILVEKKYLKPFPTDWGNLFPVIRHSDDFNQLQWLRIGQFLIKCYIADF